MIRPATYIIMACLFLCAPALAGTDGSPHLLLTIHSSSINESPAAACLPESAGPLSQIRCYDRKLAPRCYGFLAVRVCGTEDGFLGLSFGIEASGVPVSFMDFVPCPGFALGPSQAGIPEALVVSSTAGCRNSGEVVGYVKYLCSNTGATYFDVVPNADLGHRSVINCEWAYEEASARGHPDHGAQWGGEQALSCPYAWSCLDAGFWVKILPLFR